MRQRFDADTDADREGREPGVEPPIARLACGLLVAGLALIPFESAVRAALYGVDSGQQWRVAEHWLRQITNGFVPGDRLPFVWLGLLLASAAAGSLAAFARAAHPANRAGAAQTVAFHTMAAVPLALWFGATKMIPLLIALLMLITFRLIRFAELPVAGRRPGLVFAVVCLALVAAGLSMQFRLARVRANLRACMANQKTLAGAVEMYNLDKNTRLEKLDARELSRQGYL